LTYFKRSGDLTSSEKVPTESDENSQKVIKINNFMGNATCMKGSTNPANDLNNHNIIVQNSSQTFIINQTIKSKNNASALEITNKSIFFTPSTICNYYQQSEMEGSPFNRNTQFVMTNNTQNYILNEAKQSCSSAKSQIKYTKDQLQSGEKSYNISSFRRIDNPLTVGYMHDLVKEIKKELVLNISTLEDEYTFEEKGELKNMQKKEKTENCKNDLQICSNEIKIVLVPQLVQTVKYLGIESLNPYANFQAQRNINFSVIPDEKILMKKAQSANEEFICKNSVANLVKSNSGRNSTSKIEKGLFSYSREKQMFSNRIPYYKRNNLHLQNISQKTLNNVEFPKNTDTVKNISKTKININSGDSDRIFEKSVCVESLKKSQISSHSNFKKLFNIQNGRETPNEITKLDKNITQINTCKNKSASQNLLKFVKNKRNDYTDLIQALSGSHSTQVKKNNEFLSCDSRNSKRTMEVMIDLVPEKTTPINKLNETKDIKVASLKKSASIKDKFIIPKTTRETCALINKESSILKTKLSSNIDRIPIRGLNVVRTKQPEIRTMKPPLAQKKSNMKLTDQSKSSDYEPKIYNSNKDDKIKIIEEYNVGNKSDRQSQVDNKENVNNINKQLTKYDSNPIKSMKFNEKISENPRFNKGYLL